MANYLGLIPLGSTLVGQFVTKTSAGVPTNADALPTIRTYGASGNVSAGNVTSSTLDQGNVTGLYSFTYAASGANGFASGQTYTVVVNYAISSVALGDIFTFTVV